MQRFPVFLDACRFPEKLGGTGKLQHLVGSKYGGDCKWLGRSTSKITRVQVRVLVTLSVPEADS